MNKQTTVLSIYLLFIPVVASSQWQAGGVPVSTTGYDKSFIATVADGANGAVFVWSDGVNQATGHDLFAQRIDAAGVPMWAPNGTPVCARPGHQLNGAVVTDGSDGFIIVWDDQRAGDRDVYAQRFDAAGNALWAPNGVPVCILTGVQSGPHIVPDGSGGAILAWSDTRSGASDVYAQRIDGTGTVQWTPTGVALCTAPDVQAAESILITDDGDAIVVWYDRRNGGQEDIYAQRVDVTGSIEWASDGAVICAATGRQRSPVAVSDGADGAIIAWDDRRNGVDEDIFVQRVGATGVVSWTPDGVEVCGLVGRQFYPSMVTDGMGGAILAWTDFRNDGDIFAQRVDAMGSVVWAVNGLGVSTAISSQSFCQVVADGAGGAIVAWGDLRDGYDIYAQHLEATGTAQWTPDGVAVANGGWIEEHAVLVPIDGSGAIFAWLDYRSEPGIYAQKIDSEGTPTAIMPETRTPRLTVSDAYPNPFSAGASLDLELPVTVDVTVSVFDVTGKRVRRGRTEQIAAGTKQLTFDGRDDTGRLLPSGVYFCRIKAAGETITRKMVIAR